MHYKCSARDQHNFIKLYISFTAWNIIRLLNFQTYLMTVPLTYAIILNRSR